MSAPAAPAVPGTRSQLNGLEIWFVTGSQQLYGEETLRQVAEQSRAIAGALAAADAIPVRVVWQPVLTDAGRDPAGHAGGQRTTTT